MPASHCTFLLYYPSIHDFRVQRKLPPAVTSISIRTAAKQTGPATLLTSRFRSLRSAHRERIKSWYLSNEVGQGSSYGLASGTGEWERLDAMHQGIRDYLVGKLTLAPLEKPRRILELGAGSGAWAIQAAQEYPDAEVVATDMFPLPPRPLPPNVKFQKVDITGPLPFAPGSFDVVHIRFVLCHLPHGTTVIPRLADLVAPGGYLLLDDVNFARSVGGDAPAVSRVFGLYERYMRSNHQEPQIAQLLVPKLTQTGKFSSVDSHRIPIAINDHSDIQDPALRALNETMRTSIVRAYTGEMTSAAVNFGITKDVQKALQDEADNRSWEIEMEIVLTWSRKL